MSWTENSDAFEVKENDKFTRNFAINYLENFS